MTFDTPSPDLLDWKTGPLEIGIHFGTPLPPPIPLLCLSDQGRELLRVTVDDEVVIAPDLTPDETRQLIELLARKTLAT